MENHHHHSLVGWLEITAADDAIPTLRIILQPTHIAQSSHPTITLLSRVG